MNMNVHVHEYIHCEYIHNTSDYNLYDSIIIIKFIIYNHNKNNLYLKYIKFIIIIVILILIRN